MGFTKGQKYQLIQVWQQYYDEQIVNGEKWIGYYYAKPAKYIRNGDYIADCWIVNRDDHVHPAFNNYPVPVNFSSVRPI